MKNIKYAAILVICCLCVAGCNGGEKESSVTTIAEEKKEEKDSMSAPEAERNTPIPGSSSSKSPNSAAVGKSNVYDRTYVFNDKEFNRKAVIFRIIKLDTKKSYLVTADEERLHLLDVVWKYFDDLAKEKGLLDGEYMMDDLEYVYELNDQLLYMPVYFKECKGEKEQSEELYNLVIRQNGTTFELIGQTDRALLNEEVYPRKRIPSEKGVSEEKKSYTSSPILYNNYWTNGERIKDPSIRKLFLTQMENHVKCGLTKEDERWNVRIGLADLVQNEQKDYFAFMEVVFYNTDDTVREVTRYQVRNVSGILDIFEFNDLGMYDTIIEIPEDDYELLSCKTLYEEAQQEEFETLEEESYGEEESTKLE